MKLGAIIVIVIAAGIVAAFLFLRSRVAESGNLTNLTQRLTRLKQDTNPKAFLGFCTRDEDALYFVYEGGVFNLDYELTTPEKRSHAEAFRKTAADLALPVIDTTYGDYPVLRVNVGGTGTHAADMGLEFTRRIFGHDQNTLFEFLP